MLALSLLLQLRPKLQQMMLPHSNNSSSGARPCMSTPHQALRQITPNALHLRPQITWKQQQPPLLLLLTQTPLQQQQQAP
jgi:hypothetical protein